MADKTIEELQQELDEYKKTKDEEVAKLTLQLEEEKKKSYQLTLQSLQAKKVETTEKKEEPVEFDFDF